MENMDKELNVQKWVLIVRPKIPQIPHNLVAQFVCPSPKVLNFNEKRLLWESVVRDAVHYPSFFFGRRRQAAKLLLFYGYNSACSAAYQGRFLFGPFNTLLLLTASSIPNICIKYRKL